jgi:hypothetical protein
VEDLNAKLEAVSAHSLSIVQLSVFFLCVYFISVECSDALVVFLVSCSAVFSMFR